MVAEKLPVSYRKNLVYAGNRLGQNNDSLPSRLDKVTVLLADLRRGYFAKTILLSLFGTTDRSSKGSSP